MIGRIDPDSGVQRLADRAEIAELLTAYARCIDRRDWTGLQACYADDGVMVHGDASVPRDQVPALSERILEGCSASHHHAGAPSIDVDGDVAHTYSHYLATHVSEGTTVLRQAGGWYECDLRRTADGWRFTRVRSTTVWRTGEPLHLH